MMIVQCSEYIPITVVAIVLILSKNFSHDGETVIRRLGLSQMNGSPKLSTADIMLLLRGRAAFSSTHQIQTL